MGVGLNLNALITDMEKMLRRLIGENVFLQTLLAADLSTSIPARWIR